MVQEVKEEYMNKVEILMPERKQRSECVKQKSTRKREKRKDSWVTGVWNL